MKKKISKAGSKAGIPLGLYKKILGYMPICCVDIILKTKQGVLLLKRAYEPEKGRWWPPGGRVLKNESLESAALRKAKQEIGIKVRILKKIGVYETKFKKTRQGIKSGVHTVNICFLAEPSGKDYKFKFNEEFTNHKFIKSIPETVHPYIRQALKDGEVFK